MTFEFIILYQSRSGEEILGILAERLRDILEANLNEVEVDALDRMVLSNFERTLPPNREGIEHSLLSFKLDLPDETDSVRDVVDEFVEALSLSPIQHIVKFEDPLLQTELAIRAAELFKLEMKLRRVLSIIYLHAYPESDTYDLLLEETVQPMSKDKPQKEQMRGVGENQFFHLTFGQYVGLNQRPAIKDLTALIRNKSTYEAFREEILRQPIEHEDDSVFLASLKERMDVIERMRNCVAHNRRPPKKLSNDYVIVLPLVNQAMDDYLNALSVNWTDANSSFENPWDTAAREAVENAIVTADWNDEAKTITFEDPNDERRITTVDNRADLVAFLESQADTAFYANCSRDEGEYVDSCDSNDVVEGVLLMYDERLTEFFAPSEEDDGDDDESSVLPPTTPA